MKRILFKLFLSTLIVLSFSSCEDYLEQTPDGELTLDEVFADREYTRNFLYNVYSFCPDELMMAWHSWMPLEFNITPFIGAADEMDYSWTESYSNLMNNGSWSPNDRGTWSSVSNIWYWYYQGIRRANQFIENVDRSPASVPEKETWKAEAYFLRAFYHFMLFRVYGPIPIVNHTVAVDAEFQAFTRSSIDDIIQFIVEDCDRATVALEPTLDANQLGRATRLSALALKSRVLLYAASDFYNGNTDYADFKDKNGNLFFTQTRDHSKWAVAAQAAQKCINEALSAGKKLYTKNNDPVQSYQYLFLDAENQESLFQKMIGYNDRFEELVTPRGYGGWSGLGPTQNIIDDYEMQATGKPITDNTSGYIETGYATAAHPQGWYPNGTRNMYVGRDPRFYASILFNGQNWRGRRVELFRTGKDGYANARDYSTTGYNLKKYAGPDVNITQGIWAQKFCMYFRLGEIYLNYAEAINEAEGPDKAYWYINEIRHRVGMPDLPTGLNQEQMREKIRHERRIELAFEDGHRYFDTHRWKIAEQSEGIKIYGMNISRGSSFTDNQFYVRTLVEKRVFENKHYLFPIPQHEINKNENLKQAPGWITETNE